MNLELGSCFDCLLIDVTVFFFFLEFNDVSPHFVPCTDGKPPGGKRKSLLVKSKKNKRD